MKRESASGGALRLLARGGPAPGQELVEAIVGPEIDQTGEDIGEPGLGIDIAQFRAFSDLLESGGFPRWAICDSPMAGAIFARITMGKPYSQDLRERVIATVGSGTRVCAAARLFLVSVSYVSKVVDRQRTTGETTARMGRAGRKPKLAPHDAAIRARVAAHPDATLEELQAWLLDERQVKVSIGCLWNRLKFLKLPLKKSRSEPPSRIGRMSPQHARNGAQARTN